MKNISLIVLLLLTLFTLSAGGPKKRKHHKISVESGEIPPDMTTQKFIIIGRLGEGKSYDKSVMKGFSSYTGEYVLATEDEIKGIYSDSSKYRYVIDFDWQERHFRDSQGQMGCVLVKRFFILDQLTQIKYKRVVTSSFSSFVLRDYIDAIDEIRFK